MSYYTAQLQIGALPQTLTTGAAYVMGGGTVTATITGQITPTGTPSVTLQIGEGTGTGGAWDGGALTIVQSAGLAVVGGGYSGTITYTVPAGPPKILMARALIDASGGGTAGGVTLTFTFPDAYTAQPPNAPTGVGPSGQAASLTPTLTATFQDPNKAYGDYPSALQIQVRHSGGAVVWDSGKVATTGTEQTNKAISRTYAGAALSFGSFYEVAVRFWDAADLAGPYSAWVQFVPTQGPDIPTGLAPTGKTNDLTPDFSGTYQAGSSAGTGMNAAQVVLTNLEGTVTIWDSGTVAASGASFTIPYGTLGTGASGGAALTNGLQMAWKARTRDSNNIWGPYSDPALTLLNTNALPAAPTLTSPAENGSSDVSPTFTWTHQDADGDAQAEATIDIRDNATGASLSGYPATIAGATASHTTGLTLTIGTKYQWTVKTSDGDGYGPYAAPQTFTPNNGPTVAVTAPIGAIGTPVPTVTWTYSAGGGGAQSKYRVMLRRAGALVYDSGDVTSAGTSHAIPLGVVHNGETYQVTVAATDSLAAVGTSPPVTFTASWAVPDSITGLAASVDVVNAWIALQWDMVATALTDFLYYAIYAREQGTTAWTRIGVLRSRSATAFTYYYPAAGVSYDLAVTQVVSLSGEPNESDKVTIAESVTWTGGVFLAAVSDPRATQVVLPYMQNRAVTHHRVAEPLMPWGRTKPVYRIGPWEWRTVDLSALVTVGNDATLAAARALVAAHTLLVYRDARGRRIFGNVTAEGYNEADQFPFNWQVGAQLEESDYTEAVEP